VVKMDSKAVKFEQFNPQTDNWDIYLDRLKFCFEANGILSDHVKRANFITVCGTRVYETLLALITPRKASDVTFNEIVTILTKHFSPKPNEISVSYKFYKRDQKRDESAAEYIAQLRKLSSGCNFLDLERMLRDRLVCGMNDNKLQYDLLKKDNLSYENVVDALLSSESAVRDVRMIQHASTSATSGSMQQSLFPSQDATTGVEPMDINAVQTRPISRFCYRCGDRHPGECRFVNTVCRYCKKKGHLEKICLSKKKKMNRDINMTVEVEYEDHLNGIYCVQGRGRVPPYEVEVHIAGIKVVMQVDTGASFSIINEDTWYKIQFRLPRDILRPVFFSLRTWTETPVKLLGQVSLPVWYKDIERRMCVMVAKGNGPNLLGRDWLKPFNITMNINMISESANLKVDKIIDEHKEVFKDGLGTYRGKPVSIHIKEGATPKFLKARPVPYAIKNRVEAEIDRLVKEGVLRATSYSEWATPVVPIIKKSGEVRLCGDYRSTVNEATESDTYPMPTANEIFATIAGGVFFTTLDLERAYTQVVVSDTTSKLLTLNTCKGLYTVHRLAFGVKACPGIFQRLMTSLLAGIPGVAVLIDDIIISGRTIVEMQERLKLTLEKIEQAGLRLNKKKCNFSKEKVEFLGFVIDAKGIHPSPSKIESIVNTPEPKNKRELQAFLGLYNFYERFVPRKATLLEPLHRLLDTAQAWQWTEREQHSFDTAKRLLTFDLTLIHYDVMKPLVLTCDSSEYGVGAVLSHKLEDGQEQPIAMASRTLHSHERRYSQLDKEATAIMFGITKFRNYIMGRHFHIVTDHKPLLGIFDPKKPMPSMLSPRLIRIAIALTSHDYNISYMPGSQIGSADSLSRWPQPVPEQPEEQLREILLMAESPEDFPYNVEFIAKETKRDNILTKIIHYIQCGWPSKENNTEYRPYWLHRSELSIENDCILLGNRVVVPQNLRKVVLQALHKIHSGIVQTKALARSYIWWPQLNEDIEELIGSCTKCLENRHMPPKTTHDWITPTRPWSRIHIDFAGPFYNKYFFIMVDSYSKWPEVFMVKNMNSSTVIQLLRTTFCTHGLCEVLVSDNGTSFVSNDMKQFINANNIRHVTTAPYHPATNGLAERMVQTIKDKLRKMDDLSWEIRIPNLLLGLRVTPCSTTNKSPAELLMKRRLRTILDTLHPDNLEHKRTETEITNNKNKNTRETNTGQRVMYRNYSNYGPKWKPGKVVAKCGPSNYKIETETGLIINRHIDQLLKLKPRESQIEKEARIRLRTEEIQPENINNERESLCDNNQEPEIIIEIPDAEKWADIIGVPSEETAQSMAGKVKNKWNIHSKNPYDRPEPPQETNYLI
jgi:hypothetical protein